MKIHGVMIQTDRLLRTQQALPKRVIHLKIQSQAPPSLEKESTKE